MDSVGLDAPYTYIVYGGGGGLVLLAFILAVYCIRRQRCCGGCECVCCRTYHFNGDGNDNSSRNNRNYSNNSGNYSHKPPEQSQQFFGGRTPQLSSSQSDDANNSTSISIDVPLETGPPSRSLPLTTTTNYGRPQSRMVSDLRFAQPQQQHILTTSFDIELTSHDALDGNNDNVDSKSSDGNNGDEGDGDEGSTSSIPFTGDVDIKMEFKGQSKAESALIGGDSTLLLPTNRNFSGQDASTKNKEFFRLLKEQEAEKKRTMEGNLDANALTQKKEKEQAEKDHNKQKANHFSRLGQATVNTNTLKLLGNKTGGVANRPGANNALKAATTKGSLRPVVSVKPSVSSIQESQYSASSTDDDGW